MVSSGIYIPCKFRNLNGNPDLNKNNLAGLNIRMCYRDLVTRCRYILHIWLYYRIPAYRPAREQINYSQGTIHWYIF
jgi:hypothetical protein